VKIDLVDGKLAFTANGEPVKPASNEEVTAAAVREAELSVE
jgi:hypothetical protein